ncbi:hypothetical protein [Mycobacteroides chelonae]|uniref:DUF7457 domain-containing protein n=1 Tax=Mycobacteroides chelonae TaxID=1774 RepID=UPI003B285F5C
MSTLPINTEYTAACAALGLSFWSESPTPWHIWAVDYTQRFHHLHVDVEIGEVFNTTTGECAPVGKI